MASETQTRLRPAPSPEEWPPDDTEESVVGINLHQTTILNVRLGINEAATLYRTPEGALPWQALSQTNLLGCERPNGSRYRTMPDIFVYPRVMDLFRPSMILKVDGPPVLIVEVLSESTYLSDLDIERGKGYSYARAGVREYLALDPTGAFVAEGGTGWRLEDGAYRPWERDTNGRWRSDAISVAIGLEGIWATVYTHDGRRLFREGEAIDELARRDEELARRDEELARLRRALGERREP